MGAYDALIKRANKIIDKAAAKLHSARVHLVDDEADTSELSGLVIILHSSTSKQAQTSQEASQEATGEENSENMG